MNASNPFPHLPADEAGWGLDTVVEALRVSREVVNVARLRSDLRELPSQTALATILDKLAAILFPTHYGQADQSAESVDFFVGHTLNDSLSALSEQVRRALALAAPDDRDRDFKAEARQLTRSFAHALPGIREVLYSDLIAAYQGDPAATSISEILLCYPGMVAILTHRLAHALHDLGLPFLARLLAGIAHSRTGIDIHPGAVIGSGFFIDHGTGVVIGETAIIGSNVRLYQAVTLGAKSFPTDADGALVKGIARHPIIEDNVVIYAGATVLGRITIGVGSVIGGNVWLTHSVPPDSRVFQAHTVKDQS